MSQSAKLTRGSIRGHLVEQTLPAIIGVAAIISVGLIDSYFIAQLGTAELAAVSFASPVMMAISSLGIGLMAGIASVVARALGEGDDAQALRRANFGVAIGFGFGIVVGLGLALGSRVLFSALGAEADLLPLIDSYVVNIAIGMPLMMGMLGINGVLRGMGEAKRASAISIIYSAGNWVLDPILITGTGGFAGFGVAGAAYATIIGWLAALAVGIVLLSKTALPFNLNAVRQSDPRASSSAILKVAIPAAIANTINPVGLTLLVGLLAAHGSAAVAGYGAAGRLIAFLMVPLFALSGSVGGIVGQNWGAKFYQRSREAWLYASGFSFAYALLVATILVTFSDFFAGIFSDEPQVVKAFGRYMSIAAWGYAGFGVLIVTNGAFNAIGKADISLVQSCARVFFVMLPFAWLLQPQWGASAIYGAELVANLAGGALAAIVAWRLFGRSESPLSTERVGS